MKIILAALSFTLVSHADEMPPSWKLPNKGRDCVFNSTFFDGPETCGTKAYQVWSCPVANGAGEVTQFLITGSLQSDAGGICQPTFVTEKILPQSNSF